MALGGGKLDVERSLGKYSGANKGSAMSEANKDLVRKITEIIWNSRHPDRIPEFYSSDFVADYRPFAPPRHGHDGIRAMVERAQKGRDAKAAKRRFKQFEVSQSRGVQDE